ncbi:hypothetical protein T08_12076 [Trichinella sp. T8]|nr:hypothetical protein T08_12076 [Trichinella sp. T8]
MKLVPFATRVRMDIMAFPTGPKQVCRCTSQHFVPDSNGLLSNCVSYGSLSRKCVTEDEGRILNDLHRMTVSHEIVEHASMAKLMKEPGTELCKFWKRILEGMPWAWPESK